MSENAMRRGVPICVRCERNYRCERNGVWVRIGPDAIVSADMYECPNCKHRIISGFAAKPTSRWDGGPTWEHQDTLMGSKAITDNRGNSAATATWT